MPLTDCALPTGQAQRGSIDTTRVLVGLGADASARDLQGKRPVDLTIAKLRLQNPQLLRGQMSVHAFLEPSLLLRAKEEYLGAYLRASRYHRS
jgi:hypothetical protein